MTGHYRVYVMNVWRDMATEVRFDTKDEALAYAKTLVNDAAISSVVVTETEYYNDTCGALTFEETTIFDSAAVDDLSPSKIY